jgi:hypothetical protein
MDEQLTEENFDDVARKAGGALRRPAPADGLTRIRTARRRRQTSRAALGGAAVAAVVTIGLLAVVRDEPVAPPVVDRNDVEPRRPGPIERLLMQVPMPSSTPEMQYYDLERAAALAGVDAPDPSDAAAVEEWVVALAGVAGGHIGSPGSIVEGWTADQEDLGNELGWSLIDVDRGMDLLFVSGERFSIYETGVQPAEIEAVAGAAVDGVFRIGSGPDGSPNLEERSAVRLLGIPINIAVADGVLAVADRRTDLEWWAADRADSLADDATLARMAELLDQEGALAASFRGRVDDADTQGIHVASGVANDGERATLIWLADYADPTTAERATTARLAAIEAAGLAGAQSEVVGNFASIRLELPAVDLFTAQRTILLSEPFNGA